MTALRLDDPKNPPRGWDAFSDLHPDFQPSYKPIPYAEANLILMLKVSEGTAFVPIKLRGKAGLPYVNAIYKSGLWGLGGYHYAKGSDRTLASAEAEADHFCDTLIRLGMVRDGMLPPWLDYEESGIRDKAARWTWISRFAKRTKVRLSIYLVENDPVLSKLDRRRRNRARRRIARHLRPTLYAGSFLRAGVLVLANRYRFHLAAYTSSPFPWLPKFWQEIKVRTLFFWFWQNTSKGTTKGISTDHDRNRVMVRAKRLRRLRLDISRYYPKGVTP